jgi:hypothetical protein
VWPVLPGVLIVVALYAVTVARGGRFIGEERMLIMQALDPTSVAADPWGSLLALHIQPPMMNALYAVTDATPGRLAWLMVLAAVLTTILVVDTVRACGRGDVPAAIAGVLYALLPATVLYSLFPYSTTVTALFAIITVWGVARASSWPVVGVVASAAGVTALFLTRASFTWFLVLPWLAALGWLLMRSRARVGGRVVALAAIGLAAVSVVGVQAHYWVNFGTPTLSSWSGENLSNALIELGLSDDAKARLAAQDPCFGHLIAVKAWLPADAYGPCLHPDDLILSGRPVLDLTTRPAPAQGPNYNAGARLALADEWAAFARAAVTEEPSALLRVALGNGTYEGSLPLFLGRSDIYYETLDLQKTADPWLWHLLGLWSGAFPVLAWLVVLAAAVRGIVQRRSRGWLPGAFWFACALLLMHAVPSIFGDYGENQRFRAELDPVLMVAMVVGLGALVSVRRVAGGALQTPSDEPSKDATAPGSPETPTTTADRP